MAKTTVDSRGAVTSPGSGFVVKGAFTLHKGQKSIVTALTGSQTLTRGGVYTISGTANASLVLPDPADVAGAFFTIRSLSAHNHQMSSSQVTQDTLTLTDGNTHGARADLQNVVGSSVMMQSDGLNYLIMGNSGSVVLSTPSS